MSKKAEQAAKEIYKDGIELFGRRDKNGNLIIHPETMVGILRNACQEGYEQAENNLSWHSVDESLPPIDEEVIVLTDEFGNAPVYKIAVGHIVDKDIATDFDGWNIEGVRYWMPMPEIPKEK